MAANTRCSRVYFRQARDWGAVRCARPPINAFGLRALLPGARELNWVFSGGPIPAAGAAQEHREGRR